MNGDQKTQAPETETEWLHRTANNPPSLSEPSQPQAAIPPIQPRKEPIVQPQQQIVQPAAVNIAPSTTVAPALNQAVEEGPLVFDETSAEGGFYNPDPPRPGSALVIEPEAIEWVSSGEDLQAKSAGWRIKMTLLSVVAGIVIYAFTRDIFSSGAIVAVGILFGMLGARKPPSLSYRVDKNGITIGPKLYSYREFRAFSIAEDHGAQSINLAPLKRFYPMLAIHYDLSRRDEIVDVLGQHLPLEEHRRDAFDSIINSIRF